MRRHIWLVTLLAAAPAFIGGCPQNPSEYRLKALATPEKAGTAAATFSRKPENGAPHYTVEARANSGWRFMHWAGPVADVHAATASAVPAKPDDTAIAVFLEDMAGRRRAFHMGFTPWPCDETQAAVDGTYAMINAHGDMLAYHIDSGVPWPEAYAGQPYPAAVEAVLTDLLARRPGNKTMYLGMTPLDMMRGDVAGYWAQDENGPRPAPWDGYGFGDQRMADAYANYCLELICRFRPDYVNYGIEASGLAEESPEQWDDFVGFMSRVYTRLKQAHPDLPIGFSAVLHPPGTTEMQAAANAAADLLPYTDYLGISAYPHMQPPIAQSDCRPANVHPDFLLQASALAQGKPVAVCETGMPGQDCIITAYGLRALSNPAWQNDYVHKLLSEAHRMDTLFVIWWAVADFDRLLAHFPPEYVDLGTVWRDTGLFDENLQPRPGLTTWDAWLGLSYSRP